MEYGLPETAGIPQAALADYGNAVVVNSAGSLDMMMMAAAAGGPGAHTMHPVHHPAAVQPQSYTPAAAVSASASLAFSQYTAAMAANSQQQDASQAVTQGGQGQAAGTTGGYVVAPAAAGQQQTSTFSPTYTGGHGAYISMAQPHPSYDGLAGIPQYIPQGTTTQLQLVSPHQPYDHQHMTNTQVPHMVGSGSQQQLGGGSQQQQQQSAAGTPAPTQQVTQGTNSQVGVEIGAKPPDPAIPHDQLKQMLPNQLEYYFSRGTPILARIKHKPTNRITNFVASKTMPIAAAAGTAAVNNPPPTAGGPPKAAVATNVYRPPPPQTAGMPPVAGTAAPATNQPPPPSAGQAVQIPYPVQAPSPAQVIQQPVVVTGSSEGAGMVFTTVTPSSTSTPTHAAALPQGSQDVAQVTNNSCERFNAVYNKEQGNSKSFSAAVKNLHEITSFQEVKVVKMKPPKVRKVADYTLLKREITNFNKYKPELFFKNLYEMQNYVEPLFDQGCIATALVAAVMLCFFCPFLYPFFLQYSIQSYILFLQGLKEA